MSCSPAGLEEVVEIDKMIFTMKWFCHRGKRNTGQNETLKDTNCHRRERQHIQILFLTVVHYSIWSQGNLWGTKSYCYR